MTDLWWPHLNVSGAQSYLIDAVNTRVQLISASTASSQVVVDLFAPALAIQKDYSNTFTLLRVQSTYAISLLYTRRADLDTIIPILRSPMASPDSLLTQYCWLDFNKT
ncbi:hypothetical protein DYB28_010628 [Aphanomyces astaci]|uniref:Uncharacterized protein n=1 Tax=Aphanomyces astaci TaxID=112090 RepID=A0A9X8EA84_APHAT|nr:hypothetical protein DYB28_010628 [Aphanomyces astaci]